MIVVAPLPGGDGAPALWAALYDPLLIPPTVAERRFELQTENLHRDQMAEGINAPGGL